MWIAFVDDTKQKGRRAGMGELLALGAVAFNESRLQPYAERVQAIYDECGVPKGEELKWSSRKGNWFRSPPGSDVLTNVRQRCLQAAVDCEANAVVVIFDLGRTSVQGQRAESMILEWLYERVSMMLSRPDPERALMVCDKPGGDHRAEDKWIASTLDLTNFGTDYVKPESIVLPMLTAPSHHHPHLQLADLVTGAVTAAVAGVQHGLDLMPCVQPLLHRNFFGGIGGTGVKLWPDQLVNVYHWALGEGDYMRVAMSGGFVLPRSGYPYSEDDGLTPVSDGD
jgi:hypothetical protein